MVWGELRLPAHHDSHGHSTLPKDLNAREIGILLPLAALCIFIGLYPRPILESIDPAVRSVLSGYPSAVEKVIAVDAELEAELRSDAFTPATSLVLVEDPSR
jgi:NADH:ubiquinone oxidoreductase subunit 4 (subunit M)